MWTRPLDDIACGRPTSGELLPEIVFPLYLFIRRLADQLTASGHDSVHFLAREGQLLQRLFTIYGDSSGRPLARPVYLHVSRRAMFAPALAPLAEETFATLFHQYPRMAVSEFLQSLGLTHASSIALAHASNLDPDRAETDWATSTTWQILRASPAFAAAYDNHRQTQRAACHAYLASHGLTAATPRLAVVDVGWRGTIQNYLAKNLGSRCVIDGYYLGLLRGTHATPENRKHGLLVSAATRKSPLGRVINECRAIFEILLAADHGAVARYALNPDGTASPELEPVTDDWSGLAEVRGPIRARIERDFRAICAIVHSATPPESDLERYVIKRHARMVLTPTDHERAWFAAAEHRENFGHFFMSRFARPGNRNSRAGRRALRQEFIADPRRTIGESYWPVFTLREHGMTLTERAYVALRLHQLGMTTADLTPEAPCASVS